MSNGKLREFRDGEIGRWIQFVGAAAVIPLLGVGLMLYVDVAVIKSNRWTSADQARYALAVQEQMAKKADSANVPPPVVTNAIEMIEDNQNEIKDDLKEIRNLLVEHMKDHPK